ncbi:integrase domain protein SAM domain protein [Acidithiobacillus ferrivorans SS3]|uniref:Integrase domain protein SAM domain protein n=1 Tax=Acidithiobacillus ferrivorans SS3 TaxID=743299 RepID=G0JSM2_9PROT|nr:site-specific integrase [Acidithiobacillus ferrivorans]AEM46579.1 integrase domain protein SAM domain protein [Acidithiobacillus ferrivorans SS3]OFA17180.1 integrase [Acidithiobacillus ferrivorans]
MIPSTRGITPLRQRMIDDMRMRKLGPKTQTAYIRAVRKFAGYLGRSPDTAAAEDLRAFQLFLINHGVSSITLNATITGLQFFFEATIDRAECISKMQPVPVPRKLPVPERTNQPISQANLAFRARIRRFKSP